MKTCAVWSMISFIMLSVHNMMYDRVTVRRDMVSGRNHFNILMLLNSSFLSLEFLYQFPYTA